jgi:hypothetical protein
MLLCVINVLVFYICQVFYHCQKTMAPADSHHLTKGNTRGALDSLTLEIERDPVLSVRYGHSWKKSTTTEYKDPDSASKPRRIRFDA